MDEELVEELSGRVLEAAREVLGETLVGAIVKGSAVLGDFFPGFSDFDVHLFAEPAAMRGPRSLRADLALNFQRRIGPLEPDTYNVSQIQIYFVSTGAHPADWTPPIPGTHRLIYGALPPNASTIGSDALIEQARLGLRNLDRWIDKQIESIVDKPDSRLSAPARLLGTILKPSLRQAATLLGADPIAVWREPLAEVLGLVEPALLPEREASGYYAGARDWHAVREDPAALRQMAHLGLRALEELAAWGRGLGESQAGTWVVSTMRDEMPGSGR